MPRKRASRRPAPTGLPVLGTLDGLLPVDEQQALAEAVLTRPVKAVRLRPDAAQGGAGAEPLPLPFATEPVPWFPAGRFCPNTPQPGRFLAHAAGDYFVQDAGSMLALALLAPQPDDWIADVCAAPGAKASAILEVVGPGGGFLLANEPIRGRLPALTYTLSRTGFPRWLTASSDPERLDAIWHEQFDAVLVDAPCTGQTLVGRGKQSQAAFTQAQVAHSAARQRRILDAAARLVRPGGRLVYSTCTFAAEENEQVIAAFLASPSGGDGWRVDDTPHLAAWRSPLAPGGYRLYPHRDRCAGSYAIRLTRAGGPAAGTATRSGLRDAPLPEPLTVGDDLVGQLAASIVRHDTRWEAWPTDIARALGRQTERLHVTGSEAAYRPGKHWMPAHALAIRRDAAWQPATTCDLDDAAAQAFLQGQPLPAGPRGWCVATWRGRPLGWLRGNADRLNNGLPAAARTAFPPQLT